MYIFPVLDERMAHIFKLKKAPDNAFAVREQQNPSTYPQNSTKSQK